jgi:hypothetical protein
MTKKIFLLISIMLLSAIAGYAQKKEYDPVELKKMSQADMERIFGDLYKPGKVFKTAGDPREIKEVIINGNKITTVVFNYGSITRPNYLPNIADLVWQGLGYGYEFGPLAAAKVPVTGPNGEQDSSIIIDDSFVLPTQGMYSPDRTLKWGWLPKGGYADPNQGAIATLNAPDRNGDGKPDSWPERWYSPGAGKYLWPAFLGDQATAPDEEVYFVMDDFTNQSFIGTYPYYPVPSNPNIRGLGLNSEVRILQFNNPLAEDIMFLVYQKTNASEKDIPVLYMGMQGDPHVGGPGDWNDDKAFFIPPLGPLANPYPQRARSMVYAWDDDMRGDGGRRAGYFGWKFLESPSSNEDGIDNDDDGLIDESPFNTAGRYIDGLQLPLTLGIANLARYTAVYGEPRPRWEGDEDGDWNPELDDVGIDGIGPDSPNYPGPDYGEGDGKPSQAFYLDVNNNFRYDLGEPLSDERIPGYLWAGSEPNFGLRDVSESDQLGLTSFHAAQFGGTNFPNNQPLMWEWLSSNFIDPNEGLLNQPGDNIFNFGTGPLSLRRHETQRFSMAILFGDNLSDLVLNAETSARILESDYRFAKPPEKPTVTAVPGNGRVTLYWDNKSEASYDPFTQSLDFQGYKIYRSRDYTFSDIYTITDANGVPFLAQALFDPNTNRRAQFDLIDSLQGFHPVEYLGRAVKYYIGDNTGLVHQYVDSTVNNGMTYYYAVVAYDGGSIKFGVPPSETQAVIKRNPITGELEFDINTVRVTPGPLAAGITNAEAGLAGIPTHTKGNATGDVRVQVLDNLKVEEKTYKITFVTDSIYSVLDSTGVEETFISKDTVFVNLSKENIVENSFVLYDAANTVVDPSKYLLNPLAGRIRGEINGLIPGARYKAVYRYYPVNLSENIRNEDANNPFDGVRVFVRNDSLHIDYKTSGWINTSSNLRDTIVYPPPQASRLKLRADFEIRWNDTDTSATGEWLFPADTVINQAGQRLVTPFTIWNLTENRKQPFLVIEHSTTRNGRWNLVKDDAENIVLRRSAAPNDLFASYMISFRLPSNGTMPVVLPKAGDVYAVKTTRPFQAGDEYVFTTKPSEYKPELATERVNNAYVVPNPYIAYSTTENPGLTASRRGERDLQFRNLPPKCTIRIYTVAGELVQTIEKDNTSDFASWDLLSYEGQRIAYGVYIFHVDAPGAGESIGRFAVIK